MAESWIKLNRAVDAVQIPYGNGLLIPEGTEVSITQTTSASFTVATKNGFLLRLDAQDADAMGLPPPAPTSDAMTEGPYDESRVWDALRTCYDPEIPVNIVELGLVYDVHESATANDRFDVTVKLMLTAPGCGMGDFLKEEIEYKLRSLPGVASARVDVVLDPPWDPSRMTEAARLQLGMF